MHPESYPVVEKMAAVLGVSVPELIARPELVEKVKLEGFVTETVGMYTLRDIREELRKPGRDPRDKFVAPQWRDDIKEIADLKPGMMLEGVVTNVTNFGAFVDVGVHQDGLVHVSELANRFVKDPQRGGEGGADREGAGALGGSQGTTYGIIHQGLTDRFRTKAGQGEGHETGEQARGAAAQEPGRPDRGAGHAFPHPLKGVRPAEKRSLSI